MLPLLKIISASTLHRYYRQAKSKEDIPDFPARAPTLHNRGNRAQKSGNVRLYFCIIPLANWKIICNNMDLFRFCPISENIAAWK